MMRYIQEQASESLLARPEVEATATGPGSVTDCDRWVQGVLAQLQVALLQYAELLGDPHYLFQDFDLSRPTLERRAGKLRQEFALVLERLAGLQQRVEGVLAELRELQMGATDLVLECVNTDLGVGD
jgi:hypothetical protein